jgi:hypothetical protein
MIDTGAYAQRMARYLHLKDSPVYATLGSGNSALAVTRLHAPGGYSLISNSMEIFFGVMETNQVRTIPIDRREDRIWTQRKTGALGAPVQVVREGRLNGDFRNPPPVSPQTCCNPLKYLIIKALVSSLGLEPRTNALKGRCSTN